MIKDITVVGVTFLPSRAILTALLSWLARIGLWLATPTSITGFIVGITRIGGSWRH